MGKKAGSLDLQGNQLIKAVFDKKTVATVTAALTTEGQEAYVGDDGYGRRYYRDANGNLRKYITDADALLPTAGASFAEAIKTATQSITLATPTGVLFESETKDTDTYHSIVTNVSRMTVLATLPANTAFELYAHLRVSGMSGANPDIFIRKNGATRLAGGLMPGADDSLTGDAQDAYVWGITAFDPNPVTNDYYEVVFTKLTGTGGATIQIADSNFIIMRSAGSAAPAISSGIWGLPNSSGVYTFYATPQLAVAAAVAGQTIELFADITFAAVTQTILKDGVNWQFNGHTITISNGNTGDQFFFIDNGVAVDCKLFNGTFVISDNTAAITLSNTASVLNCPGFFVKGGNIAGSLGSGGYSTIENAGQITYIDIQTNLNAYQGTDAASLLKNSNAQSSGGVGTSGVGNVTNTRIVGTDQAANTSGILEGCTIRCTSNAASLGVVRVNTGAEVKGCKIYAFNAAQNCIKGAAAVTAKLVDNEYNTSTTPVNANVTDGQTQVKDTHGNIKIG